MPCDVFDHPLELPEAAPYQRENNKQEEPKGPQAS